MVTLLPGSALPWCLARCVQAVGFEAWHSTALDIEEVLAQIGSDPLRMAEATKPPATSKPNDADQSLYAPPPPA